MAPDWFYTTPIQLTTLRKRDLLEKRRFKLDVSKMHLKKWGINNVISALVFRKIFHTSLQQAGSLSPRWVREHVKRAEHVCRL